MIAPLTIALPTLFEGAKVDHTAGEDEPKAPGAGEVVKGNFQFFQLEWRSSLVLEVLDSRPEGSLLLL